MNEKKDNTIVLVRMDKIGDLVVSMPVDQHPACAGAQVHWFVSSGLGFIPDQAIPPRGFSEFRRRFSLLHFIRMVKWLRRNRPRAVVLVYNPGWVSLAAWLAGVPERVGRRNRWHSFLFVNIAIALDRSASDRHESDYNFDFLELAFRRLGAPPSENLETIKRSYLRLRAPAPAKTLAARGLTARTYRVVHPGMGGSATNWPAEYFRALIEMMIEETTVVITGTRGDAGYLELIQPLRSHPRVCWLVDEISVLELLDILAESRSVVAPATGVMHLAASLGAPVLGIFSSRQAEHPRRWGPRGPRVSVVIAPVETVETGAADLMRMISPTQVFEALTELEKTTTDSASQPPRPGGST